MKNRYIPIDSISFHILVRQHILLILKQRHKYAIINFIKQNRIFSRVFHLSSFHKADINIIFIFMKFTLKNFWLEFQYKTFILTFAFNFMATFIWQTLRWIELKMKNSSSACESVHMNIVLYDSFIYFHSCKLNDIITNFIREIEAVLRLIVVHLKAVQTTRK